MAQIFFIDVKRFSNFKKFCSYLRTAPKIDSSGDSTKLGKINKHSRSLTIGLMTECVLHFRKSNKELDEFYLRKSQGKSKGKVRVAIIRKILVTIYYMLKKGEYYRFIDKKNFEAKKIKLEALSKKIA